MVRTSKSVNQIYKLLAEQGPLTPKKISQNIDFSSRQVYYSLKKLIKSKKVKKIPNLNDLRQSYYSIR